MKNKRERGQHGPRGEVKRSIIEYILSHDSPVEEPDLREYLKQKHGITELKNIKIHLKNLQEQKCIKKYSDKGNVNRWNINSINQIRIIHKLYSELQLTSHEKVLDLIANEHAPNPKSYHYHEIKAGLPLSDSFFRLFLFNTKNEMHELMKQYYLSSKEGLLIKNFFNGKRKDEQYDFRYSLLKKMCLMTEIKEIKIPYPVLKKEIIRDILEHSIKEDILQGTARLEQIQFLENIEMEKLMRTGLEEIDSSPHALDGCLNPEDDKDSEIYLEEKDLKYFNEGNVALASTVIFRTMIQMAQIYMKQEEYRKTQVEPHYPEALKELDLIRKQLESNNSKSN